MDKYTIIYFDWGLYNKNKSKIAKIRLDYGLVWRNDKYKHIDSSQLCNIYESFKMLSKYDDKLNTRDGSTGVWIGNNDTIKIIMFDKENEDEHLPILMMYKGVESNFYRTLIKFVATIGCEVVVLNKTKSGELNEVFRKSINVKLNDVLSSNDDNIKMMITKFLNKIEFLKGRGYNFSDKFINGWIACINKHSNNKSKSFFNSDNDDILTGRIKNNNKKVDVITI